VDPVGHILHRLDRADAYQQAHQARQQQYGQLLQNQQTLGALASWTQGHEREYMAVTPDYPQAIEDYSRRRDQQLEIAGYRNPAERAQIIQQEGMIVAGRAHQDGANPAERMYEIAKAMGYEPPAARRDVRPTPSERVNMISEGQRRSRGLGNARGSSPQGMTKERVAAMSGSEFDRWYASASPEQFHEVFGT
jgi:hypothetical protein